VVVVLGERVAETVGFLVSGVELGSAVVNVSQAVSSRPTAPAASTPVQVFTRWILGWESRSSTEHLVLLRHRSATRRP
jgi:hypothetical protein